MNKNLFDINKELNNPTPLLLKDKLLSAVAEAINELVKNLDFDKAIINAFGIIGSVINVDRIILLKNKFDEKSNEIYPDFLHEWCSDSVYSTISNINIPKIPSSCCHNVVETLMNKKPLIGNTKDMKPILKSILESFSVRSTALFPIHIGDYFWGQMGFDDCKSERNWSEAEQAILSLFSTSIAGVIERNQKREQEEQTANREALLRKVITTIRSTLDIEETLAIICEEVAKQFNIDRISIIEFKDKDHSKFTVKKEYKKSDGIKGILDNPDFDWKVGGIWVQTLEDDGHVLTIDDIAESDMPEYFKENYKRMNQQSIVVLPIVKNEDKLGVIILSVYNHCRHWTKDEVNLYRIITDQIYVAIKHAQLYSTIEKHDDLLIAFSEAINEVVVNPDLNEAILKTFAMIGNIINVDRIILFENRFDKENNRLLASSKYAWISNPIYSNLDNAAMQNISIDNFYDFSESLMRGKILVGNTEDMEPGFQKILRLIDVRSIMVFPIHLEENFWGFMGFDDCKSERSWNEGEKAILMTFAASIAGALEKNKKREQEKYNERRIRTILDNVQDGIVTVSDNCVIESCNPAILNIFGYSSEEIVGSKLNFLLPHMCSCPEKKCVSEKCFLQETFAHEIEIKGRRKNGVEFPIEIDIKKIDFDNKSIILMVVRDITQRKEIDKLKNEFISTVSHEIRTPLNGVIGYIQLLSNTNLNEEQKDFIFEAKKSSESLLYLINDILDFSKIESGKMILENISFDLHSIIEDTVSLAASNAHQKGIEVNSLINSNTPRFIYGDPGRLKQVLNNLVGNAVKFTGEGEVSITTKLVSENENSAKISFEIKDTGIGIPEDAQELIFKAFTQTDASATRKFGGTGLGLAIATRITKMMGSSINLLSQPGEGSTFSFAITFEKDHNAKTVNPDKNLKGVKILIVDNNPTNLKILSHYLEWAECTVYSADSANSAIELLQTQNDINLAFIDYNMPEKNGYDLASIIKSNPKFQHIPLILLASIARKNELNIIKDKGFVGYLTKPIKKSDLFDCISTNIQSKEIQLQDDKISPVVTEQVNKNGFNNKFKILIVEDNETNQKLIAKILSKSGFICDIASNGIEAVNAYKNKQYNLILMDCQMPEMDGYQATREIRNIENLRKTSENHEIHIPIIALTAHTIGEVVDNCMNSGMDAHISKPININKLLDVIKNYLSINTVNDSQSAIIDINLITKEILDTIMERLDFTQEEAMELFGDYLAAFPDSIKDIKIAIEENDFEAVNRIAHTLKGTSANLCVEKIRELCIILENSAQSGDKTLCCSIAKEMEEYLSIFKYRPDFF